MTGADQDAPDPDVADVEITAGTLQLLPWRPADGSPPPPERRPALVDAPWAAFTVHHATTGQRLAAVAVHRLPDDGRAGELVLEPDTGHEEQDVPRRTIATVTRWASAALGLTRVELVHPAGDDETCAAATAAGLTAVADAPAGAHRHTTAGGPVAAQS